MMDIIYLANSENTYYINLFNLTIALVYLIEKSPQLEKLKPCLTTGAPAAKWLSRLAPVRHSIVAGPLESLDTGGWAVGIVCPPPSFPLFRIGFNDLMKSWRSQPHSPPGPTALSSQTYVDKLSSKYFTRQAARARASRDDRANCFKSLLL